MISCSVCTDVLLCVFYYTDSDPAAVYSAEDVSYGPIIIKDEKKKSKMRGTAALLCVHQYLPLPTARLGFILQWI